MVLQYDEKMAAIERMEQKRKDQGKFLELVNKISSLIRFAKSQGIIGGTFVLLGLLVSNLQKLSRNGSLGGDEFVTAMREAEILRVPVLLGDAPQNDTLESIKKVIGKEIFDPKQIIDGTRFLSFSAFGIGPIESNKALSKYVPAESLTSSRWLNIPEAYLQNKSMLQGLLPILIISLFTFTVGFIPVSLPIFDCADCPASFTSTSDDPKNVLDSITRIITSTLFTELPDGIEMIVNSCIDILSFLVLIRMAKLIGTDRDSIIASKIQEACKIYPGDSLVVVIGMLHLNGVARFLLSGVDPPTLRQEMREK